MERTKEMFMQEREADLNLFLEPRNEVSTIPIENRNIIQASKAELSLMASKFIEAVDDGFADPLDTLIIAKKGFYFFESLVDGMKGKASIEENNYSKHGVSIRKQDTGVTYYYEACNDPVWNELNVQMIELKEKMKVRQEFLKTLKGETKEYANEDTGEVETFASPIYPPAKTGTPSLICTLK